MSGGTTVPAGGNPFKTIAIGVVTTVLGATAVYYLGFHESGNDEKKLRKEATVTAWNTYQQNIDIMVRVLKMMDDGSKDIAKRKTDINHELDATIISLENIKNDPRIDSRLKTLIELKIPQLRNHQKLVTDYLYDMAVFDSTHPTEEQGQAFLQQRVPVLRDAIQKNFKSDSLRIKEYTDELVKEYKLKEN